MLKTKLNVLTLQFPVAILLILLSVCMVGYSQFHAQKDQVEEMLHHNALPKTEIHKCYLTNKHMYC